jgi:hypothetical protein
LGADYGILERHPEVAEGTGCRVGSSFKVCPSVVAMQIKAKQQENRSFAYETLFAHFRQFLLRFSVLYFYDGIGLQVSRGRSVNSCLKHKTQNVFWNLLIQEASAT